MASDIKIRLVSEAQLQGFKEAEQGLKDVSNAYGKSVTDTKGNINKMKKAYSEILNSGTENAKELAGKYFQNWAQAMIFNFSGGDASKIRSQIEKAIEEITNIGGADNLAFVNMTQMQDQLKNVSQIYEGMSENVESKAARARRAYETEMAVLDELNDLQGKYSLTIKYTKEQMDGLARAGDTQSEQFKNLSAQYNNATQKLNEMNKAQNKAQNKGLQYLGTTLKSMIAHQALAKVLGFVKQTLGEAAKQAAQAEQIFNKLSTVFDGLADTANIKAKELATSIGVADSTAASSLSTVGDLLQAQGMGVAESLNQAADWVKKFQDIIAFKDIDKDLGTFAQDLMAGFLGNTRNLRSIGAVVKESAVKTELARKGLDKLTGSQLELAKMNIRAEITFKQLSNAMGATEREWDTMLSVNRRASEAWKEYKENLGSTVNEVLKPLKSWWGGVLDQINKANNAQKEFMQGSKNINVYDIENNKNDRKAFEKNVSFQFNAMASAYHSDFSSDRNKNGAISVLEQQLILFSATVEDLRKVLGDKVPEEIYKTLKENEDKRMSIKRETEAIEARKGKLLEVASNYDSFAERLLGITGVNFATSNFKGATDRFSSSETETNKLLGNIKNTIIRDVGVALESISSADISKWGDVIGGALDDLDMADLLKAKVQSYKNLFETAWNEFGSDGIFDDSETKKLEEIKKAYKNAGTELEKYNEKISKQKEALKAINSAKEDTKERAAIASFVAKGDSEKVATLKYKRQTDIDDITTWFNAAKNNDGLVKINGEYKKLSELLAVVEKNYVEQIKVIKDSANAEKQKALAKQQQSARDVYEDYAEKLTNYGKPAYDVTYNELKKKESVSLSHGDKDSAQSYGEAAEAFRMLTSKELVASFSATAHQTAKTTMRMSSYEKELFELDERYKKVAKSTSLNAEELKKLEESYKAERAALIEYNKAKASEEFSAKFNPFSEISSSWEKGSQAASALGIDATLGGALSILADLLAQTEVFKEISSILSDVIVPVLDAFLAPLLPAIKFMGDMAQNLLMDWFEPLFPIFKSIAVVLATSGAATQIVSAVIQNIFIAVNNIFQRIMHPISGGNQREFKDISEILRNYRETLEKIAATEAKIEKNTSKDIDISPYQEMARNGMITASEYEALVSKALGLTYSQMKTYNGFAYQKGTAGTTTVYSGDLKFTIDGTNLSVDDIAEAVLRKMRMLTATGQF